MSSRKVRRYATAIISATLTAFAVAAHAAWPEKPVRLMVGFAPGGSDIGGRIIAQKLSEMWGQPVVVENKPGAAGNIAADAVAKALPDGYTMLLFVNSYTINTSVYKGLTWDLLKDFAPVGRYVSSPMIVVVNAKFPVKNLKELTDFAKANPGKLFFGSAGSAIHPSGTFLCCHEFVQRDMDVRGLGFPVGVTPYDVAPAVLKFAPRFMNLPSAVCGSGDSFVMSDAGGAFTVVDMEAYALAKVCHLENAVFASIKFVTDGADHVAADDWQANVHKAADEFLRLYRSLVGPIVA